MNNNPRKIRGKFHIKTKYLLLIMALICCGLIVLTTFNSSVGKPLRVIGSSVVVPIQKGMNNIGLWFSNKADSLKELKDVMQENEELKVQVDELTQENTALYQKQRELEKLQELYKLDNAYSSYEKVAAHIIAKDPGNWFSKFKIDKGSNDGIAVDMNVIGDGGLVGRVVEVTPNSATIKAIIDDESNVSAMFSTTSDRCIVQGNLKLMDEGVIDITNIDKDATAKDSDMVVTSNVSDIYLPGILIGYANNIKNDENNLTKSGYITPVVDFAHLEEVLVIKQLKDTQE